LDRQAATGTGRSGIAAIGVAQEFQRRDHLQRPRQPDRTPLNWADLEPYMVKYSAGIAAPGMTPEVMLSTYSTPVEIELAIELLSLRGLS